MGVLDGRRRPKPKRIRVFTNNMTNLLGPLSRGMRVQDDQQASAVPCLTAMRQQVN